MKKCAIAIALLLVLAAPVFAARAQVATIVHGPFEFFQAYPGNSAGAEVPFAGLGVVPTTITDLITAVPGILNIFPGNVDANGNGILEPTETWRNFVSAAAAGVPYTIKNVVLRKVTPTVIQCAEIFPPRTISQQGTPNIRLWWPLMYEIPSTTWTLTILYGTPLWADPANPGFPSVVHTDQWVFHVNATLQSLSNLLALFHELPFGLDEVPLISDEDLYPVLQGKIAALEALVALGNMVDASILLGDFEMEVADACIGVSPAFPNPTGPGTGIAQTLENPACCKILADAEYIGINAGIVAPGK